MDQRVVIATEPESRAQGPTDQPAQSLADRRLAYAILRLTLGLNIYIHGTSRILRGVQQNFVVKYESQYATTILPVPVAHVALTMIPTSRPSWAGCCLSVFGRVGPLLPGAC